MLGTRSAHLGAASLAALFLGCSEPPSGPAVPNAILVTFDTARADVFACSEETRRITPVFCELAAGGVRFPRAYTVVPLTLPAHASIMSGLYPPRHGVRENGLVALPESAETLAELARASGFATAAFVSSAILDRSFGLAQGFELYDQPALGERTADDFYLERSAHDTVLAARAWLRERDASRPFFLWVHFYDPHVPYEPAEEFRLQAGGDAYRGEIAAADRALGELLGELRGLDLDASTLIVLTADHGEGLGEHGEPTHGALCYEATLRVPLVFRFPDGVTPMPGPVRLASAVDLAPTILARLGIALPPGLDGIDLFSPEVPPDRGVYCESLSGYLNYGWSPLVGWIDGRGKYLHSSRPELYHPLEDPAEKSDHARSRDSDCARARAAIGAVLARPALPAAAAPPDEELRHVLDALGYAQTGGGLDDLPDLLAPSELPSPLERSVELEPLLVAHTLFQQARYSECLPRVEALVRDNPGHLLALDLYALCLMHDGRFAEAQAVLRQRLERGPERADTRLNLGLALLETGDPESALAEIQAADRLQPGQRSIQEALARALDALGRTEEGSASNRQESGSGPR